ncbi:MAG: hypothetical protein IKZ92_00160 [Muribaculaceae bacterium]|nr:hypothetical protein [Muribaculaceae bacterium]
MKKVTFTLTMFAACLMAVSCGSDEPKPIIQDDTDSPVVPVNDFPMWPTPTIDDSNLTGEGYNYDYWQEHKTEAQTGDDLFDMCNVPNDQLKNMSTPNLAWTCFTHPYQVNWLLFNSVYDGILSVITRFNGYEELMKRKGGTQAVIDLYARLGCKKLESERPGITLVEEFDLASWVLVMCTAADYQAFSQSQAAQLADEMLNKKWLHAVSSDSHTMLRESSYLLGGFLAYHYDTSLNEEEQTLLANYIRFRCNGPGVSENVGPSHTVIDSSLQRLAAGAQEN